MTRNFPKEVVKNEKAFFEEKSFNLFQHCKNLAKVFFVLSAIAVVFAILSFFDSGVSSFNAILNLVNAILSVGVYFLFIKAASAVRNDALNATK